MHCLDVSKAKSMCLYYLGLKAFKAEAHPVNLATVVAPFFDDHSLDVYKIFGGCLSENELLFLNAGRGSDGSRGLCRSAIQSRQHRVGTSEGLKRVCVHKSWWIDATNTLLGAHACL